MGWNILFIGCIAADWGGGEGRRGGGEEDDNNDDGNEDGEGETYDDDDDDDDAANDGNFILFNVIGWVLREFKFLKYSNFVPFKWQITSLII